MRLCRADDRQPAQSGLEYGDLGRDFAWAMRVPDEGFLVIRLRSTPHGEAIMGLATISQIEFERGRIE